MGNQCTSEVWCENGASDDLPKSDKPSNSRSKGNQQGGADNNGDHGDDDGHHGDSGPDGNRGDTVDSARSGMSGGSQGKDGSTKSSNRDSAPSTKSKSSKGSKGKDDADNKDGDGDGDDKPNLDEFGNQQPRKQFRILLLGAGESGKTTFTQQLTLLYNLQNMTMEERKRNTLTALHENVVQCISATAANALRLNIDLTPEDKERLESIKMSTRLDKVVADDVEALWYSEGMQRSYAQKSKYWVLDTVDWLMENVQRFAADDYVPTRQDMILSRRRTTGITEHTYMVDDVAFTIIDVGGQRSERRKWVQFFADVHCIVFFVSVIGFCKVLFEDRNTFQMKESLELFSSTFRVPAPQTGPRVDNDWQDYVFETTPIHVVFNKVDMLDDCLSKYQLNACFPSYQGQNVKRSVLNFLQQTFADRIVSIRSPPDTHFISAANEFDVQELFTKLTTFLIEKERAGLALNAFMGWEQKHGNMRTNALDRKPPKPGAGAGKPSDEATKKRQRQRIKRIRELMCEN